MPLTGNPKKDIPELIDAGHPQKQAVAIALKRDDMLLNTEEAARWKQLNAREEDITGIAKRLTPAEKAEWEKLRAKMKRIDGDPHPELRDTDKEMRDDADDLSAAVEEAMRAYERHQNWNDNDISDFVGKKFKMTYGQMEKVMQKFRGRLRRGDSDSDFWATMNTRLADVAEAVNVLTARADAGDIFKDPKGYAKALASSLGPKGSDTTSALMRDARREYPNVPDKFWKDVEKELHALTGRNDASCPKCGGSGKLNNGDRCLRCLGTGEASSTKGDAARPVAPKGGFNSLAEQRKFEREEDAWVEENDRKRDRWVHVNPNPLSVKFDAPPCPTCSGSGIGKKGPCLTCEGSGKAAPKGIPRKAIDGDTDKLPPYNAEAVEKEIKKDPRIKGKEAKLIHRLLKGRHDGKEYGMGLPAMDMGVIWTKKDGTPKELGDALRDEGAPRAYVAEAVAACEREQMMASKKRRKDTDIKSVLDDVAETIQLLDKKVAKFDAVDEKMAARQLAIKMFEDGSEWDAIQTKLAARWGEEAAKVAVASAKAAKQRKDASGRKYYTLLVDGAIHFGDYDRAVVVDEMKDVCDSRGISKGRCKIVTSGDQQADIDKAIRGDAESFQKGDTVIYNGGYLGWIIKKVRDVDLAAAGSSKKEVDGYMIETESGSQEWWPAHTIRRKW